MADSKLHPAVTVANIKASIPIILDNEAADYNMWSELFRIHCTAYLVSDHLSPRPKPAAQATSSEKQPADPPAADSWERLDAIVLQWIYGTISPGLLKTVIKSKTTAYDAWKAIEALFQDNKATRALYLKQKFANTRLENFSSMHAYCQELKVLAGQLQSVDAPVDESDLVLQTLAGLIEQYETVQTVIQNTKPLPSFLEVRSQLCMSETTKANQALHSSNQAATSLHTQSRTTPPPATQPSPPVDFRSDYSRGRGRSRDRGRRHAPFNQTTNRSLSSNAAYSLAPQHPISRKKAPILRCNSSGDLYPLTTNFIKSPTSPIALAAITQERWHQRLGHPGTNFLHSLKSSSFINFMTYGHHQF
ncbi:uncharacterized protein LOC110907046 [Helianthus annuus]|uniref:uncharacterized protein LOC110907046 n=1 Tax=Helianthus annuus TaxID=4232 RepID=UPI000B8F75AF|nr:uncharacterized protein LOC110907046 [Helianthus annuus]